MKSEKEKIGTLLSNTIIPSSVRHSFSNTRLASILNHYWNKRIALALLIIILFLGVGIIKSFLSKSSQQINKPNARIVKLISAESDNYSSSTLNTTGIVRARAQGDLRTQIPGIVTSIRASVGQYVQAGTIIATTENATQRAGVAQALAGVAQATAQLNKIEGGTRQEQLAVLQALTKTATAQKELALTQAKNTLLSAYATTNTVFAGSTDSLFATPDGANPRLLFRSTNSNARLQAMNKRLALQVVIERQVQMTNKVSDMNAQSVKDELFKTRQELQNTKSFLDVLITALNSGIASASIPQTVISSAEAMTTARRVQVLGTLSALNGALERLTSSQSALLIAKQNEDLGKTGAQKEDRTAARARLDASRATYSLAIAQLEKTYVRAPVSGTIQTLSISVGDFVGAFQSVGLVANKNALEVRTYLAPQIAKQIAVGADVRIQSVVNGIVTSIAPGIGASGQITVRIAVLPTPEATTLPLISGERVSVAFSTNTTRPTNNNPSTSIPVASQTQIIVPITALKLNGNTASVFIVDTNNKVRARKVTLGAVVQNSIEILSGIKSTTRIVRDVRGLSVGDTVVISVTKK